MTRGGGVLGLVEKGFWLGPSVAGGDPSGDETMAEFTVELPEELVVELGSREALAGRAKQALVLDLLRQGQISQGQAAALLGVSRWDILDLMARDHIPSSPLTAEEAERDVEVAERRTETAAVHAGG